MIVKMLAFASSYFSESGLINGLRRIQIKKNPPLVQVVLDPLGAPNCPTTTSCLPASPNKAKVASLSSIAQIAIFRKPLQGTRHVSSTRSRFSHGGQKGPNYFYVNEAQFMDRYALSVVSLIQLSC
jgi:hypothetical protein